MDRANPDKRHSLHKEKAIYTRNTQHTTPGTQVLATSHRRGGGHRRRPRPCTPRRTSAGGRGRPGGVGKGREATRWWWRRRWWWPAR